MPSSISKVAAISGTVQATRNASLAWPAPKSRATAWSRTSPSRAATTVSPAAPAAARARNGLPDTSRVDDPGVFPALPTTVSLTRRPSSPARPAPTTRPAPARRR